MDLIELIFYGENTDIKYIEVLLPVILLIFISHTCASTITMFSIS